jgi:hypothetical protein
MAQSKASTKAEKFDTDEVYPVTTEAPAQDDKVGAVIGDASPEDSPVRTQRPDQPIAAVMAGGVGEHKPPDPDQFDRDGRFTGDIDIADNREDAGAASRETR